MFIELSQEQKKVVEDMLKAGRDRNATMKIDHDDSKQECVKKPQVTQSAQLGDYVSSPKRLAMMKVESGPNKVETWGGKIPPRLKDIDIRIQEQYGDDVGDDF